jgi:hypothetical protein
MFLGPRWNIASVVCNTCNLDSFLNALYIPYRAKQLHSPYPELEDPSSLLSRSFILLDLGLCEDARILWLQEYLQKKCDKTHVGDYQHNIYGEVSQYFDLSKLPRSMKNHPLLAVGE